MKVQVLSCPACGADIDYNGRMSFCPYCGRKLLIDDGVKRVEINQTVNINHNISQRKIDEARVRRIEARLQAKEAKLQAKEEKRQAEIQKSKVDAKYTFLVLFMGFLMMGVLLFGGAFLVKTMGDYEIKEALAHPGEIKVKMPAFHYKGNDYEQMESEFCNLGFTDIELVGKKAPKTKTSKKGTVVSISINGDTGFSGGTFFPKDAKIIITYYLDDDS